MSGTAEHPLRQSGAEAAQRFQVGPGVWARCVASARDEGTAVIPTGFVGSIHGEGGVQFRICRARQPIPETPRPGGSEAGGTEANERSGMLGRLHSMERGRGLL